MGYLILLRVLQQRRLSAEAGALAGALVLPPDGATRFIRDTLNLSISCVGGRDKMNKNRGQLSFHTAGRRTY